MSTQVIDDFKEVMPVVEEVANPALKKRHWQQVRRQRRSVAAAWRSQQCIYALSALALPGRKQPASVAVSVSGAALPPSLPAPFVLLSSPQCLFCYTAASYQSSWCTTLINASAHPLSLLAIHSSLLAIHSSLLVILPHFWLSSLRTGHPPSPPRRRRRRCRLLPRYLASWA